MTLAKDIIGCERCTVAATEPVAPGKAAIRLDFAYDGGLGKDGTATLSVDGQKVAEGHVNHTVPLAFSGDEGADVGIDEATNVTDACKEGDNRFIGKIHKVTVEMK
jgi:arylsulfatase